MLDEALRLAGLGYQVFPCRPRTKKPATAHGYQDASTDTPTIEAWWLASPAANVAIAAAGLVVIDVDDCTSAWYSEHRVQLEESAGAIAATPRGGVHYLFRRPADAHYRCSAGLLAAHIDVRTDGGYLVVAPSITDSGTYAWTPSRGLEQPVQALPEPPDWLTLQLESSGLGKSSNTRRHGPVASSLTLPGRLAVGERNARLTSFAGSLRRGGLSPETMQPILMKLNAEQCDPPLPEREVASISASVGRYPPGLPSRPAQEVTSNPEMTQPEGESQDGREPVVIGTDEHRVTDQVIQFLAVDEHLFQRSGRLVRVVSTEPTARQEVRRGTRAPVIAELPIAGLRDAITRRCVLFKPDKDGNLKAAHPPEWLPSSVAARRHFPGFRELAGISTIPVLRPDGSIWQTPGYDLVTGMLYRPDSVFPPIPERPTVEQAGKAALELCEVVADFPFEQECDRAGWLAALLSIVGREAYDGPAPLFLADANIRGAGKGLLMNTIGHIIAGRDLPVSSYSHEEEEMRKKITSIALAGDRVVLLDNLEGKFGNAALDRLLTCVSWHDRILGRSERVDIPISTVWLGTGNNVVVAADTARRVVQIRLDILDEHPEDRTKFVHPDLLEWVGTNRPRLLAAAYTILRAYIIFDRPDQKLRPMGSFEGWSRLIRSAVRWVGMADPCAGRDRLVLYSDSSTEVHQALVEAWREYDPQAEGLVIAQVVTDLYPSDPASRNPDHAAAAMRTALETLTGTTPGRAPDPRRIAAKLKAYRRRVVRGLFLDTNPAEKARAGSVWRLYRQTASGVEPAAGTLPG